MSSAYFSEQNYPLKKTEKMKMIKRKNTIDNFVILLYLIKKSRLYPHISYKFLIL